MTRLPGLARVHHQHAFTNNDLSWIGGTANITIYARIVTKILDVAQILAEPPGQGLQSEEEIGTIAKEARIPVMTNQADDIDDLAGEPATLYPSSFR